MERTKKTDALVKEMERVQEYLETQEVGSEEYNKALVHLRDLAGDISKQKQDRKDRYVRIADIAIKAGLVTGFALASFKFEEDGKIFTSMVGRGIMKNFIPKL